ncbi:MAG: hypothetical protein ACJLTB_21480 [Algoriphagus aquaeductus]|uniref:hypothetical protein n=1 Tax=Algoriphagus aquaeductus TaxID=475299 RepID=UPI003879FF29
MKTLRIKAYPKNKQQIQSIADFLKKEGIEFELVEKEEFLEFISEVKSSLGQIKQIQEGKQKKSWQKTF